MLILLQRKAFQGEELLESISRGERQERSSRPQRKKFKIFFLTVATYWNHSSQYFRFQNFVPRFTGINYLERFYAEKWANILRRFLLQTIDISKSRFFICADFCSKLLISRKVVFSFAQISAVSS